MLQWVHLTLSWPPNSALTQASGSTMTWVTIHLTEVRESKEAKHPLITLFLFFFCLNSGDLIIVWWVTSHMCNGVPPLPIQAWALCMATTREVEAHANTCVLALVANSVRTHLSEFVRHHQSGKQNYTTGMAKKNEKFTGTRERPMKIWTPLLSWFFTDSTI